MIDAIIEQISAYPYVGLFVLFQLSALGAPLPEDMLVIVGGVLAQRGIIDGPNAWVTCYLSVLVADTMTLHLGWFFGKKLLHRKFVKRMLHPRRVLKAKHQIQKHGAWMIVAARFIPGSRLPVFLIAGMLHLHRGKYLIAEASTLIITISIQFAFGWWVSSNLDAFAENRTTIIIGSAVVGLLIIGTYIFIQKRAAAKAVAASNAN